MAQMKTPGVYIVEKNAFPNSVVQVATAVPAFIGHTEKAELGSNSLSMKPFRLSSMGEFELHYGSAPAVKFNIVPDADAKNPPDTTLPKAFFKTRTADGRLDAYSLEQDGPDYCLYSAMRMFFQNGGGACYIVSIGSYEDAFDSGKMMAGIKTLIKEPEPTMVVIPETTRLPVKEAISIQQAMLAHCGAKMRNRFAILDIHQGHLELQDESGVEPIKEFRNALGTRSLDFGAAYYPWVETTAFTSREFSFMNIANKDLFATVLKASIRLDNANMLREQRKEVGLLNSRQLLPPPVEDAKKVEDAGKNETGKNGDNPPPEIVAETAGLAVAPADPDMAAKQKQVAIEKADKLASEPAFAFIQEGETEDGVQIASDGQSVEVAKKGEWTVDLATKTITFAPTPWFVGVVTMPYNVTVASKAADGSDVNEVKTFTAEVEIDGPTPEGLDKTLRAICPLYNQVMDAIAVRQNTMSPAGIIAGVYTAVDNSRGVWKAPANISLNSVVKPIVNISHDDQEDLNVTAQGKSINAIRPFVGEGTLVWGARTLDGNSLDWRYINVRRTMIMIEESIRLASKAYVFEPNTANTWVTMRAMIENFLTSVWKQGGLAGAVPADAFSVHVGLGETMTANDILEGILRITVLVAVVRPAEFIEVTFQQQMQKS